MIPLPEYQELWQYMHSFRHNVGLLQTDGRRVMVTISRRVLCVLMRDKKADTRKLLAVVIKVLHCSLWDSTNGRKIKTTIQSNQLIRPTRENIGRNLACRRTIIKFSETELTGFQRWPLVHRNSVVLVLDSGRREHEPNDLAASSHVEIRQLVLRHRVIIPSSVCTLQTCHGHRPRNNFGAGGGRGTCRWARSVA